MAVFVRLLLVFLPLLLAACWTGAPFYSASEMQAPIAPGVYRMVGANAPSDHSRVRISVRADGYTILTDVDEGDTNVVGFSPLPGGRGLFVAWFQDMAASEAGTLAYGLLEPRGSEYRISFPMCSETKLLAGAAGAAYHEDPKVPLCAFPNRTSLEEGLRRAAAEGPMETLRLIPAGRGKRRG